MLKNNFDWGGHARDSGYSMLLACLDGRQRERWEGFRRRLPNLSMSEVILRGQSAEERVISSQEVGSEDCAASRRGEGRQVNGSAGMENKTSPCLR